MEYSAISPTTYSLRPRSGMSSNIKSVGAWRSFYRKARKYLKLEESKEALLKAEGMTANKKNGPGTMPNSSKRQDKRRGKDKQAKSQKKQRSGPVENRGPPPKYTNYHSLNALLDHIYVMTNKCLYRSLEPMKSERTQRDIKRNCAFHKDVDHIMNRCVALKDEIEKLIRVGHFKEFVDEQHATHREE